MRFATRYIISALLVYGLMGLTQAVYAAPMQVVVTIAPLHDLTTRLLEGTDAQVTRIISRNQSPHAYHPTPTQARALRNADAIIYVSDTLEPFVTAALQARRDTPLSFEAVSIDSMRLLPIQHHYDTAEDEETDPHIWLDPRNMIAFVEHLSHKLSSARPDYAPAVQINSESIVNNLKRLDEQLESITQRLPAIEDENAIPYIAYHNALRYFETRYNIEHAKAVTSMPEHPLGAKTTSEWLTFAQNHPIGCIMHESMLSQALSERMTEASGAVEVSFDPLGRHLGSDFSYELLLGQLAGQIDACYRLAATR